MVVVQVLVGLVVLAVVAGLYWYVWRRLVRDTTSGPGLARRAGVPFWLQQVLAWPGFLWMALSIYLLLGVVAGATAQDSTAQESAALELSALEPAPAEPPRPVTAPSRRLFVSRAVGGAAAAVAVGTVGYGTAADPSGGAVRHHGRGTGVRAGLRHEPENRL
ncbi:MULTISPECIES: hypothetical protein [unclassified Streptomyces]|uniref:hypothetical protein n=1 Tax=unclassified Streptomyces TaxID=2593676 RepID=UPI00386CC0A7